MSDKLDKWGRWKKEAIREYDRASTRFFHTKSPGEIIESELKKSKLLSKLSWYDRLKIKALARHGRVNRKNAAAGHLVAEAAANLAPDTKWGVFFDLGTLGIGSAAKILKLTKVAKVAGGLSPIRKGTFDALQSLHKAAGYTKTAERAAKVQRARHIYRGAHIVDEAADATHSAILLGSAATSTMEGANKSRPIYQAKITPRTPFTQHPWSQIPVQPKQKKLKKAPVRRRRGTGYSFLDQVKVADWTLQSMRKSPKQKVRSYDPSISTIERLKRIEKRAEARVAEERRVRNLLNRFKKSIFKPQPLNAHEQMWQKYGAKIDAIAKKTPKFTPGSAQMSSQDWASLQKKLGIRRSPLSPMPKPITSAAGQRLRQNPLRSYAGPLLQPNRARPMMKPMFR